ncbi:ribonuclease HII [Loigolactobacillus coryniformis]|uniref:Ribonuclease HII n=1 Tax=Loigolactobacillus coryniformis subsp. torquens DSM 20004 = KCTC 3535 TaxID=1423822 RepID=A0A2D1KNT8_9LACO|nr:ribonuclease HII [Loigolactobacillus coryniformis]ATO43820.1 ribonuclease HII [Loigolactobacillus coryniformis subsp. torquens DSM 20004 = KCTC 3535]KRK80781.1 ribonuclease HII (RNase HII) [Loigolactobacillus coryniformis subsp. torquens DSM 20004 = KCTC 3535]
MTESIAQVKQHFSIEPTAEYLAQLATDPRKGVQQCLLQYEKKQAALAAKKVAFLARRQYEDRLWPNYPQIAGIDEVGRGPLAGPVVTAAVILPHDFAVYDVNDSKQLSATKRQLLYRQILEQAVSVSIGVSDVATIDRVNILEATKLAMSQAIAGLSVPPDHLLIDAVKLNTDIPTISMFKGDSHSISIAAASIVAKVVRDHLMLAYDQAYPGYDFADNEGYGTTKHLAGLANYGVTPIHRRSFAPVKKYLA